MRKKAKRLRPGFLMPLFLGSDIRHAVSKATAFDGLRVGREGSAYEMVVKTYDVYWRGHVSGACGRIIQNNRETSTTINTTVGKCTHFAGSNCILKYV